jgi:hypothetical protein
LTRTSLRQEFNVSLVSDSPPKSDFESESSRLNEGLKSCRAVMENYRAMMSRKQPSGHPSEPEETVDSNSYASAMESASGT